MRHNYIKPPSAAELRAITQAFRDKWHFPQVAGAIVGTHIRIQAPNDTAADYFNRKRLMKPFPEGRGITPEQAQFSHRLSQAQMTGERAFGRLKVSKENTWTIIFFLKDHSQVYGLLALKLLVHRWS
ncbi:hypothetical protein SKAU_G00394020 [Synaphobranchus kaupii]|uniref:Uncharacterized protein n=1 Tax=Synaphobranchus kaupii TaxID=118154 RepID=A0A9Q1IDW5_SYNKA|nr:hypothetical protein SKAU_G00394020 [Synaphobranchus kaupii]